MTDVVEIARSRRAKLLAEIARLDDFIGMAETLLRLGDDPAGGRGWLTDTSRGEPAATDPAKKPKEANSTVEAADAPAAGDEADPASLNPASFDAGALDPDSLAREDGRGRNLFAPQSSRHEEELVLGSGEDEGHEGHSATEAGLDAAIGQKLRQRRWMIGMTKRQLAERLGIGVEQIQDYELGLAHVGTSRMWELAAALDVPTSYFFEDATESATEAGDSSSDAQRASVPAPARELALARTA